MRGEIELRRADADAHLGEAVAGLLEQLGGVQQRLRRDAADVEAGAAEGRVLLDHGDLHAELRRADGADIAAGAGADDDEVVGHGSLFSCITVVHLGDRSESSRASLLQFISIGMLVQTRPAAICWLVS